MTSAVVFAYHDVGVRCLSVLLAQGIDVRRVYTHADDSNENIWFGSVAELARLHGIPVTVVGSSNQPGLLESVAVLQPDFLFSFYYRFMLPPELLSLARRGAFNMHGSLLPKYRGRVPVNWAIIQGERETGATLHEMVAKPDAGRLVDQLAVPILPNDAAFDVFRKVTVAAETVLYRALPLLVNGTATLTPQNLAAGSYHGGRKPEDGRVNWKWSATQVHNLVRAVAPPYPGAFCEFHGKRLNLLGTMQLGEKTNITGQPALLLQDDRLYLRCTDGGLLRVTQAEFDSTPLTAANFQTLLGGTLAPLSNQTA
jgi:methionyl-tRNA formyltransferase